MAPGSLVARLAAAQSRKSLRGHGAGTPYPGRNMQMAAMPMTAVVIQPSA